MLIPRTEHYNNEPIGNNLMIEQKAVKWYLKNIEMPNREILDEPGFIGENLSGEDEIYLRNVALPEEIFIRIEECVDNLKLLYRIGKEFGYRYAAISELDRHSEVCENEFCESTRMVLKYLESVCWWKTGNFNLDYDKKTLELELDMFIECNRNGKGYLFLGSAAGFWSYMVEDEGIEAAQRKCQGRDDDKCKITAGPKSELQNNFEVEINLDSLKMSKDYNVYNEIKSTDYAKNSMEDFEEIGFFEHREGLFYHNDFRYIWAESSLIELVGSELGVDYEEELFNSAFQVGKEIVTEHEERNMEKFIVEYLSATGWGDTKISKKNGAYQVHSLMFPWTRFTDDTSFPVFRGIVSGMITGFEQEEVRLNKVQKDDKGGSFSLLAEED